MTLRLRILSSVQEIKQIEMAWEALAAETKHPMSSAHWYVNACSHAHQSSDEPHIITLWDAERLAAIAPLILTEASGEARYEVIGARTLYEPSAMLARHDEAATQLAAVVAALRHPVLLARLDAAAAFNDRFIRAARRVGLVFSPSASGSPYIELSASWDAYHAGLPSRLKNVIRRGRRQLEKIGHIDVHFIRPAPHEVEALLHEAFEVEVRSWKGRAGSAVLLRPALRGFFFQYAADLAGRRELLLSYLRLDGVSVAMQVANLSYDSYWQLKIGYDETYAKQLVGLQLQLETIKWAFEHLGRRYEFLGTAEPWIREWTGAVHPYRNLLFYPFSISGMRTLMVDNLSRLRQRFSGRRQRAA